MPELVAAGEAPESPVLKPTFEEEQSYAENA
jgi:hypothetical protein